MEKLDEQRNYILMQKYHVPKTIYCLQSESNIQFFLTSILQTNAKFIRGIKTFCEKTSILRVNTKALKYNYFLPPHFESFEREHNVTRGRKTFSQKTLCQKRFCEKITICKRTPKHLKKKKSLQSAFFPLSCPSEL